MKEFEIADIRQPKTGKMVVIRTDTKRTAKINIDRVNISKSGKAECLRKIADLKEMVNNSKRVMTTKEIAKAAGCLAKAIFLRDAAFGRLTDLNFKDIQVSFDAMEIDLLKKVERKTDNGWEIYPSVVAYRDGLPKPVYYDSCLAVVNGKIFIVKFPVGKRHGSLFSNADIFIEDHYAGERL